RLAGRLAVMALVEEADAVVVVARPRLAELHRLAARAEELRGIAPAVAIVLVGERPYGPDEVAGQLGIEVAGVIADDPFGARLLAGEPGRPRALHRSALLRSARALAATLSARPAAEVRDGGVAGAHDHLASVEQ